MIFTHHYLLFKYDKMFFKSASMIGGVFSQFKDFILFMILLVMSVIV